MKKYYKKFIDYIINVGGNPKIDWFDNDWKPIGPSMRKDLREDGIIYEENGKIFLVEDK